MLSAASEVMIGKEISALIISWRPVAVVLFPILASILLFLVGSKLKKVAGLIASAAGMITFLLVLSLYPLVKQGIIEYRYSELMSMGLFFRVDYLSFIFAFLVSFCWMGVLIYAVSYMKIEERPLQYFSFALLTLGSCLGVVLTGDLISLFLFFELMTFSSSLLVIVRMDREAMSAGIFTLYMGVAGGLVLLFGIFLLYSAVGTVELKPLMDLLAKSEISPALIFTCFFIGFGIKAGVVPLHLWMPRAYAASPAVVNALSSGAMIKAGIYGIIRILMLVLTPTSLETGELFSFAISTGYVVMWMGLLTMVVGAVMALMQGNILRLLAYSSISQVGYIITGLGAGAYLFGAEEAMGYSGAVLHAFNHTLYKTAFFLIVGIIVYKTGELEIKKLGGLGRKMPLLTAFFILCVLAIAGIPGFNGYISKTLIHDALLEAHHHFGGFHLYFAEKVFMLGSALTLCYYMKFFQGVFLGTGQEQGSGEKQERHVPWLLYLPLFVFALFILAVGIYPNFFVEEFVLASTNVFTFEPYSIKHIMGFRFFDSHPVEASIQVLLLGLALYLPLNKWKLYDRKFPSWMSIENLIFAPAARIIFKLLCRFGVSMDGSVNNFYLGLGGSFLTFCRYVGYFDSGLDNFYETSSHSALDIAKKTKRFDDALNAAYEKTSHSARDLADRTTRFDGALNKAYEKTGDTARRMADRTTKFDEALDKTYENTGKAAMRLAGKTEQLDRALDQGYEKAGTSTKDFIEKRVKGEGERQTEDFGTPQKKASRPGYNPSEWNIRNINFDSLLLALMLGLVIFILFYFVRDL
ncbi:MAG: complex I subunit 5 family protein [Bacillota bacterium]|nr:complex I subunit 5 family protein [Bacillota bacterium]